MLGRLCWNWHTYNGPQALRHSASFVVNGRDALAEALAAFINVDMGLKLL